MQNTGRKKIFRLVVCGFYATLSVFFSSCFTGIEGTRTITEKDVAKSLSSPGIEFLNILDSVSTPSVIDWYKRKQFYVTDDNFKLVLIPDNYNPDTLQLAGKTISYVNSHEDNYQGLANSVILSFVTDYGLLLKYDTGKSYKELRNTIENKKIPFLIDLDVIKHSAEILKGRQFYLNSSLWTNEKGEYIKGCKYENVSISDVLPGNKVYSLKIKFKLNDGSEHYILSSIGEDLVSSRLFGNLFSDSDPHKLYPQISDEVWENIKRSKLSPGMTKDECRMSKGMPQSVRKQPTYNGLQEIWLYDSGATLIFFDGFLENYRL